MSKMNEAVAYLKQNKKVQEDKIESFDFAINIRKNTISEMSILLKSMKGVIKTLNQRNQPTRRVFGLYAQLKEDYDNHVTLLVQLKELLSTARTEAYYLSLVIDKLEK